MIQVCDLPGIQIRPATGAIKEAVRRPTAWPIPADFPIIIDAKGKVVSRYGDCSWNLAPWRGRALGIAFGDGDRTRGAKVTPANADIFRQVTGWWVYGPNAVRTAGTLAARHRAIKPIFVIASDAGISAGDFSRYPKLIEKLAGELSPSEAGKTITALHDLYNFRDMLGFVLLDQAAIALLAKLLPDHEPVQSAYIPPRIWTYQLLRLKECLDEYVKRRDEIEACYRFCLDAYETNIKAVRKSGRRFGQNDNPFEPAIKGSRVHDGRKFYGRFRLTAERFEIAETVERWVGLSNKRGIKAFSDYLSLVTEVGIAYVLNFSLMRIDEATQLRVGCHSIETDVLQEDIHMLGDIHSLSGVTTKTIHDEDARWIVSPSCKVAIDALTSITLLRNEAASINPAIELAKADRSAPLLRGRSFEPWIPESTKSGPARKKPRSYSEVIKDYPLLFDQERMRITAADAAIANMMTFGLDEENFGVGKIWPLSWHQLRRTGACNMLCTGLVSEASLQYQLKQATRGMARYYGQNHFKLKARLDEEARGVYVREMYQSLAREFEALADERYLSPHGEKRKAQILSAVSEKDHRSLVKEAASGEFSYRETFFGGCAKPGPACPFGGISNITACMGHGSEKPCEWVMLNKRKLPIIERLLSNFEDRLNRAAAGSHQRQSIEASIESAERAIHVINSV